MEPTPSPYAPQDGLGAEKLVDFIVIGAMRAGTTLLHDVLSSHPQISMARSKETDFFIPGKNLSRGTGWYRSQFDATRPIHGEISPNYAKCMDFPGVPAQIHAACPKVRLIYLLRDPVTRAMSQYGHSWNMGELRETPAQMAQGDEYPKILDASSYARQLQAYLEYFPQSQILLLEFEGFLAQPQAGLDLILRHIGAAPMAMPHLSSQNANDELSRVPKSLLRLSQSRLRPMLTALIGPRMRGRMRKLLARGPQRQALAFPPEVIRRISADLAADTRRLRQMTGQEFAQWSI